MFLDKLKFKFLVLVAVLVAPGIVTASPAQAITVQGCAADTYYTVTPVGNATYSTTGPQLGMYNSSSLATTLSYVKTLTTVKQTSWTVNGGLSLSFAMATINASTSYTVTQSSTSISTVTATLGIPGLRYGYIVPKAEMREFDFNYVQILPTCGSIKTYKGRINAVVTPLFFSTCVATAPCTPAP